MSQHSCHSNISLVSNTAVWLSTVSATMPELLDLRNLMSLSGQHGHGPGHLAGHTALQSHHRPRLPSTAPGCPSSGVSSSEICAPLFAASADLRPQRCIRHSHAPLGSQG